MDAIKKFNEEAAQLHNKFEQEDGSPTLYHYRGKAGSLGIINDKELCFADYKYLQKDDKKEIGLGHTEIIDCPAQMAKIAPTKRKQRFWEFCRKELSEIIKYQSIYVLSLSHKRDDKKLWEEYVRGNGTAIGFNFKISSIPGPIPIHRLKVFYDSDAKEFKSRIDSFLKLAEKFLSQIQDTQARDLAVAVGTHVLPYLPVRKNQNFDFEAEYRLVMPGIIKDDIRYPKIDSNLFRKIDPDFDHVAHKFEPDELTAILIGSCSTQEFEDSIRKISKGYTVNKSKIILPCN